MKQQKPHLILPSYDKIIAVSTLNSLVNVISKHTKRQQWLVNQGFILDKNDNWVNECEKISISNQCVLDYTDERWDDFILIRD